MKTVNTINELKKHMVDTMLSNFKKFGNLAPILFFMVKNELNVGLIPSEMLSTHENKEALALAIKRMCKNNAIQCVGIIMEAWAKNIGDDELSKLLINGNMRVSECKEKQEIILMIFSTPDKEEFISYIVEPKTKCVLHLYHSGENTNGGTFSNFFELRKQYHD